MNNCNSPKYSDNFAARRPTGVEELDVEGRPWLVPTQASTSCQDRRCPQVHLSQSLGKRSLITWIILTRSTVPISFIVKMDGLFS